MISRPIRMTDFTKKVMSLAKKIPRGKVATYGQIAALAGKPHGARGVGWILNSSSEIYKLPWQRVINSKGRISFPKKTDEFRLQKKLLLKEKVTFSDDGSISLDKYRWQKKSKTKRRGPRMFA